MTINSPLPRALISPLTLAAVQLLTRQSVTPLLQTAFFRLWGLLCEARKSPRLLPGWPTRPKPTLGKCTLPTYLTQKGIEIPNNAT
jgi:hypothetical protein